MWDDDYMDLASPTSRKLGSSFTGALVTLVKEGVGHNRDINAKVVKIS